MPEGSLKYDVIIVGGGPAGSTAGYLLCNFGFNVLIIDKSNFPRRKLCGGCISYKTLKLLDRLFDETESSLRKKHILNFQSDNYEVFYKNKRMLKNTRDIPFYFVDRQIYDSFLLEKAKEAGVEVIEGDGVKAFNLSKGEVITATGKRLKAKFIVGADGANSIMRKEVFLKDQIATHKWKRNLATALEVFIDRAEIEETIDHPIIVFGFVNWGYSWIFPSKDKLIVGLGGLNSVNKSNLLDLFHNFLSSSVLNQGRRTKIAAHPVPAGNFLLRPVFKNVILVGDAAGFVNPITGEGIFYAQRSAELASWAIYKSVHNNENLETSYLQLLRKYVYPELEYAKRLRWFVFVGFNKLRFYPFKIIVRNIMESY